MYSRLPIEVNSSISRKSFKVVTDSDNFLEVFEIVSEKRNQVNCIVMKSHQHFFRPPTFMLHNLATADDLIAVSHSINHFFLYVEVKINAHLKSSLEKKRRVEKWENMMHLGFKNEFPSFIMGGNYFKRRKRGKIQNCLGVKILWSFARLFFLKVVHQLSKNVILSVYGNLFQTLVFQHGKTINQFS